MDQPHEQLFALGELLIERHNADGVLVESFRCPNLVTTVGKNVIANRLGASPSNAAMTHMAIGTSSTAAANGDTTLVAENARVAITSGTPSTNTIVYIATFAAGTGTATITEAGMLNASSAGDLLCRTVFTGIVKASTDSLTITWTVTIS